MKTKVKCTQYCHSGHFNCGNLPASIIEQTEVLLVSRTETESTLPKRKRGKVTPVKSSKKLLVNQNLSPPHIAHDLRPTVAMSLPTRSRTRIGRKSTDDQGKFSSIKTIEES